MNTPSNLKGKVVIITGASSGIGAATAYHLAEHGAIVVLGARRKEKLETITASIRSKGGTASFLPTDVTQSSEVEALVQLAVEQYGKLDAMINNAGLMALAPLSELKVAEWDRMIDINIKGVLYGIAAALPVFQEQGFGHFVNISSVAGQKVYSPGGSVYSGTKFAVRAITEGFRNEVGEHIRSTTIEPGAINTELASGISHSETFEQISNFFKDKAIPPSAIARAIAYALEQPQEVDVNEIVIRPTAQVF